MIRLELPSGTIIEVRKDILHDAKQLRYMIEDCDDIDVIPLNSDFEGIAEEQIESGYNKIIEYLEYHYDNPDEISKIYPANNKAKAKEKAKAKNKVTEICNFDDNIFNSHTCQDIITVTIIADYLSIDKLEKLCCYKVANLLRGKTTEEMRDLLDVEDDLTEDTKKRIEVERQFLGFV